MPRLVCTIDHLPYGGVVYREGDRFIASDEDARLLKGFGKARDDVSGYHTASMDAEPVATQPEVLPQPDVALPRRRGRPPKYLRADMRAED